MLFKLTDAPFEVVSETKSYGGTVGVYRHHSEVIDGEMEFAVYVPPTNGSRPLPALWYLSGLTCTWENVCTKAGAQAHAAEYGMVFVMPDTSPRDAEISGEDDDWDFGTGAGFYVDATKLPWANHYRMYSYICVELFDLVGKHFPVDGKRQGITGHSMGGHGSLIMALKQPEQFQSVSAIAPVCHPVNSPWGKKAFLNYLGSGEETWKGYDATELIKTGKQFDGTILIDQGTDDSFLSKQLKPGVFEQACEEYGQPLDLRMREGYDHSYYFVSTVIGDHFKHHSQQL